jgi:hypothetical protein
MWIHNRLFVPENANTVVFTVMVVFIAVVVYSAI